MRSGGSWSGKVKRSAKPSCQASQAARVTTASAGAVHAGSAARITASLSLSQPCRIGLVQLLTGWRWTCPVGGWNSVRILHVPPRTYSCGRLVRPDCRVTLRPPTAARLRYSLDRARLVLAPDRQTHGGAERVGSLDQPLFTAASGSTTVTVPCLRRRATTPVWHHVRLLCQLWPAACRVRQIVQVLTRDRPSGAWRKAFCSRLNDQVAVPSRARSGIRSASARMRRCCCAA